MAWAAAALAALTLLGVLALRSPDRQQSLVDYQAAGTMRHIATERVRGIRLSAGPVSRSFQRSVDGRWQVEDGAADAATATAASASIEAGLRLLHNTPPERDFEAESPEFGLTPPALRVELRTADGQRFEAAFGAANPMGLAHYVRIRSGGRTAVHLMPSYLAEAWAPALPGAAR
ncbi:MAG: hypothetical protein Q7S85_00385 [Rugosibacter sp.]|nr:hypothetical protein [Rhodocyclales bacterium]MDO8346334.1 hypothetical protein [Rugosibacter sp.]